MVALDHQGHGLSEGDRAYFQRLSHMVDDVLQLTTEVCPAPEGVPRILLGHSMGGLISLHVLHRAPQLWKAAVITGPALYFDPELDTALNRAVVRVLTNLLPKLPVQSLGVDKICSDVAIQLQYSRDPLNYCGGIRVRMASEMMQGVAEAMEFASEIKMPLLVQHGEEDVVCRIQGSETFLSRMGEGKHSKTKLLRYPRMMHEIFNERGWLQVIEDTTEWILQRTGELDLSS